MMRGTAVQRAFHGHLLVDQCLTCQTVTKIMEGDPGFQEPVKELEKVYKAYQWNILNYCYGTYNYNWYYL